MLAIDTNVVVRVLTADDPAQSPIARAFIDSNPVFVSLTVLLECEWVLRSSYDHPPESICHLLRTFIRLPTVTVESPALVASAFELVETGMDFADALHLCSAEACDALVTFDRKLGKTARSLGIETVRELS